MARINKEGVLTYQYGNLEVAVRFPELGNTSWHVSNVLAGKEYPILPFQFKPDHIIDQGERTKI